MSQNPVWQTMSDSIKSYDRFAVSARLELHAGRYVCNRPIADIPLRAYLPPLLTG